jgi:hypothetical protein
MKNTTYIKTILATLFVAFTFASSASANTLYDIDRFGFYDRSGNVYASGTVNWYRDLFPTPTIQGVVNGYVTLKSPGCLWVRFTFNRTIGSVSLPAGVSISGASITDGYFRKCGAAGTTFNMVGMNEGWSAFWTSITIRTAFSPLSAKDQIGSQATYKSYAGYL